MVLYDDGDDFDDDDDYAYATFSYWLVMIALPVGIAVRMASTDRPSSRAVVRYRFAVSVALCAVALLVQSAAALESNNGCPPKVKKKCKNQNEKKNFETLEKRFFIFILFFSVFSTRKRNNSIVLYRYFS